MRRKQRRASCLTIADDAGFANSVDDAGFANSVDDAGIANSVDDDSRRRRACGGRAMAGPG
jgi:hypothetical protein